MDTIVLCHFGVPQIESESCRTVLMTTSARRSLERKNPELIADLDRYFIETILAYRRRADDR